ncbi:MAG: hypothetical protein ChlgKO_01060 [Chlamydiales bacterium]
MNIKEVGISAMQVSAVSVTSFIISQNIAKIMLENIVNIDNSVAIASSLKKARFVAILSTIVLFTGLSKEVKLSAMAIASLIIGFTALEFHSFFDDENQWVEADSCLKDISWKAQVPIVIANISYLYFSR